MSSGPSKDAQTGEVIWRHRPLDADGIVSPGEEVEWMIVFNGYWIPFNISRGLKLLSLSSKGLELVMISLVARVLNC